MDDLDYQFTDLKGKYEQAATNEYVYKKKFSEAEDKVRMLEEDIEDLEVKKRMHDKIVK